MVYNNWDVISKSSPWICKCLVCGKQKMIKNIYNIIKGHSKSCGCKRESRSKGYFRSNELYGVWYQMKKRCSDPNHCMYKNYGGRGITVCDKWYNSIECFLNDVGKRPTKKHSLDRIDNSKGYEPGNVRWATQKEQNENQRPRIDSILIEINGEKFKPLNAAIKLGVSKNTILNYYHRKQRHKIEILINKLNNQ